ncbi:MAG: hypothetical protein ACYTE8_12270 [Planctomycetota bacterium]|jgi:hypothetical protein
MKKYFILSLLLLLFFVFEERKCVGLERARIRDLSRSEEIALEEARIRDKTTRVPQAERAMPRAITEPVYRPEIYAKPEFNEFKMRINQLPEQDDIKLQEITNIRTDLARAATETKASVESLEYQNVVIELNLKEKEVQLRQSDERLYKVNREKEYVTLWKNIFSGGFVTSFLANLVVVFGLITKMSGSTLERKLKKLEIAEKKARLENEGIDFKKYL